MTPQQADIARQAMRIRARTRAKQERVAFTVALYRVRRSVILRFLSRRPGQRLTYIDIARGTAVPVSAVRTIYKQLVKIGHGLVQGRGEQEGGDNG